VDLYIAFAKRLYCTTTYRNSALISPSQSDSQAFSEHCEIMDTGWCITRYACLLPPLTPGTHSAWPDSGWV